jgi:hypothetical protein
LLAAGWLLVLAAPGAAAPAPAPAAPQAYILRSAAGPNAAAIQPTVDTFRTDLGANNGVGSTYPSGRREINWDGVPDANAAPANLPPDFFNAFSERGAHFSTPGTGVQASMDDDAGADADPDQVRFSHLNAGYAASFVAFSQQRLFAPLGSTVLDVTFTVPGTTLSATVAGFGAVFTDVDNAAATTLEFFDAAGQSLGAFTVPASNNGLSFVGVSFTAGERAARVRLTLGTAALGPDETGGTDVVALDDFIYGEPRGLPSATLLAVTTSNQLYRFTDANPALLLGPVVNIVGLQAAEYILAIDARPRTGEVFALGSTSRLYRLDPATGLVTVVGGGPFSPTLSGTAFGIDFSPTVDRLRVVSSAEQNLRLHPDTAAVFLDTALNPPGSVVAAGFDRNTQSGAATTLFGIDSVSDELVRLGGVGGSPSPNTGAVTAIGPLGVDTSTQTGLDSGRRTYALLTVAGVAGLYEINLATGKAYRLGSIGLGGPIIGDITVLIYQGYLPLLAK